MGEPGQATLDERIQASLDDNLTVVKMSPQFAQGSKKSQERLTSADSLRISLGLAGHLPHHALGQYLTNPFSFP